MQFLRRLGDMFQFGGLFKIAEMCDFHESTSYRIGVIDLYNQLVIDLSHIIYFTS